MTTASTVVIVVARRLIMVFVITWWNSISIDKQVLVVITVRLRFIPEWRPLTGRCRFRLLFARSRAVRLGGLWLGHGALFPSIRSTKVFGPMVVVAAAAAVAVGWGTAS